LQQRSIESNPGVELHAVEKSFQNQIQAL
jgi:hypothetical protein